MKKIVLLLGILAFTSTCFAQLLTWAPEFPKDNDNLIITLDATRGNQGLNNYSNPENVYVHIGVTTNLSTGGGAQWLYVNGTIGGAWGSATPGLKATSLGNNKYQYTITNIRNFFNVPAGETIQKIGVLFRDANANADLVKKAANSDNSDMFIPVYDNNLAVRFTNPFFQPLFTPAPEPVTKATGDNITITAIANKPSTLTLTLNGTPIQTATNATSITATPTLTTVGTNTVVVEANDGSTTKTQSFQFFVSNNTAALPAGTREGINYNTNNTEATLVLYAPGKNRVCVIGEFAGSNWTEQDAFQMTKTPDGNYWWKTISGLTPGTEYAYQFLVDGSLKIADPYSEKILDPFNNNDQFITAATYPGLRTYPAGQTGIVSLLQTAAPVYNWQVNSFQRPDKRNLVIYELLVRDFVAAHDWKTITDSLNYLKTLGINAIEVMPFNEFEGNVSWGYNPDYYFAPDKYYGPKNTLKQFIDSCHSKGIAVIMDIALNHSFGLSPQVQLYFDNANNRPAANNPWFNAVPKHAFNVGYDMNHESLATRYFVSRVTEHWLKEYKMDGFRFDLSKGFTQVQTCDGAGNNCNVDNWGNYDASRVAIWKRYYDTLQLKSAGSYAILEHFAADQEEIELSNYGMMLWGNLNYNYNEASMGYVGTSNFERGIYSVRNWSQPNLVTYMESHDEERLMYKNVQFGNSSGTYSTKDLNTALSRMEMNAAFFLTIPGPKMIWQFGELGYDFAINRCEDGSINNDCRLSPKPIRWDYLQNTQRKKLYDVYSNLNKLRFNGAYKDVFIANNISIDRSLASGFKWLKLRSATDSSMLCVVGNFDVTAQTADFTFPAAGTWYDYLQNTAFSASGSAQSITLQPGEYHLYTNRNLNNTSTTPVIDITNPGALQAFVFSNPVSANSVLDLNIPDAGPVQITLGNMEGRIIQTVFNGTLSRGRHLQELGKKIAGQAAGVYLLRVQTKTRSLTLKLIVE